jgi:ferrous iron transport protein B
MTVDLNKATDFRIRLDRILTHKVWGYLIFFSIMLLIFQAIYNWSTYPMDFIDVSFATLSES